MKSPAGYLIVAMIFFSMQMVSAAGAAGPQQIKEYIATIDQDGVQRVEILGGGYFFDPNYIIVRINVPVELTVFREPGIIPHNIVMKSPEAGIEFDHPLSTSPASVTFIPTKVGKYPIYCSKKLLFFRSHRDKGMEGTLEVRN